MLIRPVMTVNVETPIEGLLKDFKAGKSHIAVVHGVVNNGEKDPFYQPTGIITMEDIIEALMQQEIEDEHDLNRLKAETDQLHKANSVMLFSVFDSKDAITDMELEAIKNFIIKNIEPFNPTRISKNRLERLLKKARVLLLDGDEDEVDVSLSAIVYESDNSATDAVNYTSFDDRIPRETLCQRGAACNYFYLILSGEVELRVGIEGIITSIGPYNCLGIKAVNEPMNTYIPDYTAKVNKPSRILRISQKLYLKYASLT